MLRGTRSKIKTRGSRCGVTKRPHVGRAPTRWSVEKGKEPRSVPTTEACSRGREQLRQAPLSLRSTAPSPAPGFDAPVHHVRDAEVERNLTVRTYIYTCKQQQTNRPDPTRWAGDEANFIRATCLLIVGGLCLALRDDGQELPLTFFNRSLRQNRGCQDQTKKKVTATWSGCNFPASLSPLNRVPSYHVGSRAGLRKSMSPMPMSKEPYAGSLPASGTTLLFGDASLDNNVLLLAIPARNSSQNTCNKCDGNQMILYSCTQEEFQKAPQLHTNNLQTTEAPVTFLRSLFFCSSAVAFSITAFSSLSR